jgi:predicted molibdopterin-dependent oxidoreductase YjgC
MSAPGQSTEITVNGRRLRVEAGSTVASALLNAGVTTLRRSSKGDARGPLCVMGICYECRVTIDGISQQRACMTVVTHGMIVESDGASS